MTRATLLVFLAVALLAGQSAAASLNLLANGDFGSGFASWTQWGDATCAHEIDATTDDRSYHLEDTSTSSSCGLYQTVSVTSGILYAGSVNVNVHSGTVQMYLRWVDNAGDDVCFSQQSCFPVATSVGTGMQQLAASGVAPLGATSMRFWIYVPTSHTADVHADDATLV